MLSKRISIICPHCNPVVQPEPRSSYCSLECRFWDKVEIFGSDDCWNWTAKKFPAGYGQFWYKKSNTNAQRVAWILTYGPIPKELSYHGICVLHKCDNRACCNPSHLFLGSHVDNVKDMFRKNRQPFRYGEYNGNAKLTENQVKEIKVQLAEDIIHEVLAIKYGVAKCTISHISTGTTWSHV